MYTGEQIDAVLLRASRAMLIISDRIQDNFLYLERDIYDELRFKQRDIYVLWKCLTDAKNYRDDYDTYDALINVLADKCADVDSYNPNYTTLNPNYQNISGNTPNPHPSDFVTLEEVQELLADYALLPDRILTGLEYSYLAPTATISAGTYKIDNVEYSANSTPFPITPTTTGLLKYVRFYATTSSTIAKVESTPSSVAEHPDIPDGTLGLYEILVNDAGVDGGAVADLSGYFLKTGGEISGDVILLGKELKFGNSGIRYIQLNEDGFRFATDPVSFDNHIEVLGASSTFGTLAGVRNANIMVLDGNISTKLQTQSSGDSAGLVGTESNHDFKVVTNNIERLRVLASGEVQVQSTASVANPTADAHAVNKGYADATYAKIEASSTTGTALVFTEDRLYGTVASPETGNITADVTGAKLFASVMVIHNSGSTPTFDSKFAKLSGSGDYTTGVINYIFCQYINATKILYSISQEA